jgi:hypothetical protein
MDTEQPLEAGAPAEADTYAQYGSSTNYGKASTLRTDRFSSGTIYQQAFLRFDLRGKGTIRKAVLRVYVTNGSNRSVTISTVSNNSWGEQTLTWTNQPEIDGPVVAKVDATSSDRWYGFDVTAAVKPDMEKLTLAMVPQSSDGFDFYSRETGKGPQLLLTTDTTDAGASVLADAGTNIDAGTAKDAGTTFHDAGTPLPVDAGTSTDGGTVTRRTPCVDPLTGVQRSASDTEKLTSDVFGRIVRSSPTNLCLYGNGHKVDQGHIEPADAYTWSRTESGNYWEDNYHSNDNAVDLSVGVPIVENIAMYNSGQGVMLRGSTQYFAVRDVYIQHAGDDGIESDFIVGGVIDDVLIDKSFSPIAWRMSSAPCEPKANNVVKVSNSILRSFPQYGIYPNWASGGEYIPGYATVFKWEKVCQYATKLELKNVIIVANQDGMSSDNLNLDANGNLIKSENNILVWLGKSPYTGKVPPGFTVTSDINVFVRAWHDWFRRHPDIQKPSAEPDLNYALPALQ